MSVKIAIPDSKNIELMFPDKWLNSYEFSNGRTGRETLEIKNVNEYYIGGVPMFTLKSKEIDKEKQTMEFMKVVEHPGKTTAFTRLIIVNGEFYTGIEGSDIKVTYSKINF